MMATSGPREILGVSDARPLRGRVAMCLIALAGATSACGGDSSSPDTSLPDAPGVPKVTIKTYPREPPYDGRTENTGLLAFQDGDNPWEELQGTSGVYSTPVTGQRYTVAAICRIVIGSASLFRVDMYYLSVSDTTEVKAPGCVNTGPAVRVWVELQGVPSGQRGEVFIGGTNAVQDLDRATFQALVAKGEPVDVLASVFDVDNNVPRRVYRGPTLDALADQTLQYDLSVLGGPLDQQPLTVTGLDPMERAEVRSFLSTRSSQPAWFVANQPVSTAVPDHYFSVPVAAGRQPDDITEVTVSAAPEQASSDGRNYLRSAFAAMTTPAPTTAVLPAPWSVDSPSLDNTALRRVTLTIPMAPATQRAVDYYAQLTTLGAGSVGSWNILIGAGWTEGKATATVTTPDLRGLAPWFADVALPLDRDILWILQRSDRNFDFGAAPADGLRVLGNGILGVIHSPSP
jgi:hypothetical protein